MKPSEKRKLIARRDVAQQEVNRFEKAAQGKSRLVADHFMSKANEARGVVADCNFYLKMER